MSQVHKTRTFRRMHASVTAPSATLNWLTLVGLSVLLSGCTGAQAPDFLILNSYFPSWLVGAIAATPVAVAVRYGLIRLGVDNYLPLRFFVYIGLWLILALAFAYLYSPR